VESGRAFIRNESSDDDPFEIQTIMPSPNESQRVVAPVKNQLKTTKMKLTFDDEIIKQTEGDFAALIGLDWGSQEHALCLYDCTTGQRETSTLEYTPKAIAQWAAALARRFPQRQIALCLEQAKGALISSLMAYPFLVLYPVNPATAARYRQAFTTSRAKSDPPRHTYEGDCSSLWRLQFHSPSSHPRYDASGRGRN
jgi:hypothetical protein